MSRGLPRLVPGLYLGEYPVHVGCRVRIEQLIARDERLVTDAEVLQEILHRYAAIERRDAIQPAFDAIVGIVDEICAIEAADVDRAKIVLAGSRTLSTRDALHVAIMERYGVDRIMSFDAGFDIRPGIAKISATS